MSLALSPHPALPYVYVRPIELASNYPSVSQLPCVYTDFRFLLDFYQLLCMYQHAKDQFWLPQDVRYDEDATHWTNLSESERFLLSRILAFMTACYGSLYDNTLERFSKDVNILEARYFFEFQTVS